MRLRWAAHLSKEPTRLKMSADSGPTRRDREKSGEAYFMGPAGGSAYWANNYLETALLGRTYLRWRKLLRSA
jgi:hypothetical protein